MGTQNKFTELKDICDKAFKRSSIYPLMEIPKPDNKGTIEEQLNDIYIKAENAKKEMQAEIISGWINDVNIRIEAGKRFGNKKNKNIESEV